MTAKTHTVGGYVAGAGTILLLKNTGLMPPNGPVIELLSTSLILYTAATSAVLPDIDEIRSRAGRKLLFLSIPFLVLQIIGKLSGSKWFRHRGITHYLITWLISSFIIAIPCLAFLDSESIVVKLLTGALLFFPVGYLSHILLDLISGRIALFYPLIKKPFGITLFPYNSIRETILRFTLILLSVYITIQII